MENQDLTFLMHEDRANEISEGAWSTEGEGALPDTTLGAGRLPAAWAHSPWPLLYTV